MWSSIKLYWKSFGMSCYDRQLIGVRENPIGPGTHISEVSVFKKYTKRGTYRVIPHQHTLRPWGIKLCLEQEEFDSIDEAQARINAEVFF